MTLPMRRGRYPARRWDPLAGLPGFDDLFDQMSRMLTSALPDVARISINSWSPPVDIQETDDEYMVEADLPGVQPDDVTIDLEGRELRILGQYGGAEEGEGEQQRVRRSGRFDYRVTLPGEVKSESCSANLEHGVLRLRLPKASSGARQRIPVQADTARQADSGPALKTGTESTAAARTNTPSTGQTSTAPTDTDKSDGWTE
ncbi:MAG TPA: Hsp20/alpha crystallin family protein [Pseudonocardiaceae bacterium]|jgi:HSP20 family protein|nr:Hsp20/alpha crystallin family protein [Pseudonocardiaceae bacterium]